MKRWRNYYVAWNTSYFISSDDDKNIVKKNNCRLDMTIHFLGRVQQGQRAHENLRGGYRAQQGKKTTFI